MSSGNKQTNTKEADEIDLGRIIGELIDHRKLIISITALFTLLALVYAIFSTPISFEIASTILSSETISFSTRT